METASLDREIANYERLKKTVEPRYAELLRERGERGGLRFAISLERIKKAAVERRFLSYGEIAEANGMEWSSAYRLIGSHLGDLVTWSSKRGLPMISAIVVDKPNVATGAMDDSALRGFIRAAIALGHFTAGDERAFLKEQQVKVFESLPQYEG
jgi:hypothetical protein